MFFKAVYGEDNKAVRVNLIDVAWLPGGAGKSLRFNKQAGAAEALEQVSRALARLPDRFDKYLTPTAGTFNWRAIAGTYRLSAHAFGIAIDINPQFGDYWRWRPMKTTREHRNRIPFEIVDIFEANGFIWGGKWYHFDTLHFEYRPELLDGRCAR